MITIDIAWLVCLMYHFAPGPLAQWLERATHNRPVAGSSPARATRPPLAHREERQLNVVVRGSRPRWRTNADLAQ